MNRELELVARAAELRPLLARNAARSEAVEMLVSITGGSAFPESNPIQRHWRDIGSASRHASLTAMTDFEIYGRALLGREANITHIV